MKEPDLLWTFVAEEPRMEGFFWKTLLLVGVLSASGHSAPSQRPLTYDEAVEQGVVIYNSKAEEDTLYRLLEAVPQPDWVGTLHFSSIGDSALRRVDPSLVGSDSETSGELAEMKDSAHPVLLASTASIYGRVDPGKRF